MIIAWIEIAVGISYLVYRTLVTWAGVEKRR